MIALSFGSAAIFQKTNLFLEEKWTLEHLQSFETVSKFVSISCQFLPPRWGHRSWIYVV